MLLVRCQRNTIFEVIEVVVDDGLRHEIAIDLVASGLKVAYPVHHDHSCCGV